MLKIIIQIVFVLVLLCWLANFEISIKPFKIALPNWRAALGIILICIGAGIYYDAGRRKGWNAAIDKVINILDGYKKEKK